MRIAAAPTTTSYPNPSPGLDLNRELGRVFENSFYRSEAVSAVMASRRPLDDAAWAVRGVASMENEFYALETFRDLVKTKYTGRDLAYVGEATGRSIDNDFYEHQALASFAKSGDRPSHDNVQRYAFLVGSNDNDFFAYQAVQEYFG
ncbi:MAG: hypothetical protein JWM25_1773 [Thermoleophilia bacterium]|nr:hypothetical protein [Thermoleophilia bacterium]MCZ4497188.1 hypothetical protein [Thermoleophilia bacterium]